MSSEPSKPTRRIVVPHAFRTKQLAAHIELKPLVKVRDPFALDNGDKEQNASSDSLKATRRCGSK